jgi:hypothetical protein
LEVDRDASETISKPFAATDKTLGMTEPIRYSRICMASKTAQQEEEGFIGVIGNSQVDGESS